MTVSVCAFFVSFSICFSSESADDDAADGAIPDDDMRRCLAREKKGRKERSEEQRKMFSLFSTSLQYHLPFITPPSKSK